MSYHDDDDELLPLMEKYSEDESAAYAVLAEIELKARNAMAWYENSDAGLARPARRPKLPRSVAKWMLREIDDTFNSES